MPNIFSSFVLVKVITLPSTTKQYNENYVSVQGSIMLSLEVRDDELSQYSRVCQVRVFERKPCTQRTPNNPLKMVCWSL